MKTIEGSGTLIFGKMRFFSEDVFRQQLKEIGNVPYFRWYMEYGNKRTVDQNSYLWGAVIKSITVRYLQEGWNYTEAEVYRRLENSFCLEDRVNTKTNEFETVVVPFKELTTEKFEEIVIRRIREWAISELDCYINLPHEHYGMSLEAYNEWKQGNIDMKEALLIS